MKTDTLPETMQEAFGELEEAMPPIPEKVDFGLLTALTSKLKQKEAQFAVYSKWFEIEKIKLKKFNAYVSDSAELFARATHAETQLKSWTLPDGSRIQLRQKSASLIIQNMEQVILWARESCPEALQITVSKIQLRTHIKCTGEIPTGAVLQKSQDLSFSISIPKGVYNE